MSEEDLLVSKSGNYIPVGATTDHLRTSKTIAVVYGREAASS
jgi:hypothetical protein